MCTEAFKKSIAWMKATYWAVIFLWIIAGVGLLVAHHFRCVFIEAAEDELMEALGTDEINFDKLSEYDDQAAVDNFIEERNKWMRREGIYQLALGGFGGAALGLKSFDERFNHNENLGLFLFLLLAFTFCAALFAILGGMKICGNNDVIMNHRTHGSLHMGIGTIGILLCIGMLDLREIYAGRVEFADGSEDEADTSVTAEEGGVSPEVSGSGKLGDFDTFVSDRGISLSQPTARELPNGGQECGAVNAAEKQVASEDKTINIVDTTPNEFPELPQESNDASNVSSDAQIPITNNIDLQLPKLKQAIFGNEDSSGSDSSSGSDDSSDWYTSESSDERSVTFVNSSGHSSKWSKPQRVPGTNIFQEYKMMENNAKTNPEAEILEAKAPRPFHKLSEEISSSSGSSRSYSSSSSSRSDSSASSGSTSLTSNTDSSSDISPA